MNVKAKRTTSGQHEAVIAHRQKMESVQEGVLEELAKLNAELDAELAAERTTVIDLGELIPGPEES